MRMPAVQFTVRLMMIGVLVVALACGWVARQQRRQALLAMAKTQMMVTNHINLPYGGRFSREFSCYHTRPR